MDDDTWATMQDVTEWESTFWSILRRFRMPEPVPLFLAPMAGVTDVAYRLLAKEAGAEITPRLNSQQRAV